MAPPGPRLLQHGDARTPTEWCPDQPPEWLDKSKFSPASSLPSRRHRELTGISVLAFRFGFSYPVSIHPTASAGGLWGFFIPRDSDGRGKGPALPLPGYEKRPQGLIASDFSDTLPSHPPSFHLFPSLPSRRIGVCPPYLITCVGTRMDKGVGKHQKVRLLAVKTEIRDETAGLSPSLIRKLTTLLDWHRCHFTSRY